MEPQFSEGDRVLTFNWIKPKKGDVVVFCLSDVRHHEPPQAGRRILRFFTGVQNDKKIYYIKRVQKISDSKIIAVGDNKPMSSKIGPIKLNQIIGKVVMRY